MNIVAESERLILRRFIAEDAAGIFALDSNPEVLTFIDTPVLTHIEQAEQLVARIQAEYEERGVARLAVVLKSTQEFIGWAGLKLMLEEVNGFCPYYDLGYRFLQSHWGQGYGFEAAQATLDYGLTQLHLESIYAVAHRDHVVSQKILKKIGMQQVNEFVWYDQPHFWFEKHREN